MASRGGNSSSKAGVQEKDKDKDQSLTATDVAMGAGLAALAVWGISKWFGNSEPEPEPNQKMMKAPGRPGYIPRDGFEKDPSAYFKGLREKK